MAKGGALIVTADHGNCEQMIDPETDGPHTAHTTYPVNLIVVDDRYQGLPTEDGWQTGRYRPNRAEIAGLRSAA